MIFLQIITWICICLSFLCMSPPQQIWGMLFDSIQLWRDYVGLVGWLENKLQVCAGGISCFVVVRSSVESQRRLTALLFQEISRNKLISPKYFNPAHDEIAASLMVWRPLGAFDVRIVINYVLFCFRYNKTNLLTHKSVCLVAAT